MLIRLSRIRSGPVLACIREDGSTTWSKSRHGEFFARHDLMHNPVETTLGFRENFFGLIAGTGPLASGANRPWSIPDFEVIGALKLPFPP